MCIPKLTSAPEGTVRIEKPLRLFARDFSDTAHACLTLPCAPALPIEFCEQSRAQVILKAAPLEAERFEIHTDESTAVLSAGGTQGAVYALGALFQLMKETEAGYELPKIHTFESPRFGWRGLLTDISRHFFEEHELKQILDVMAMYRLNRMHLHICDDQGFRLEIKHYPQLTQHGANRLASAKSMADQRPVKDERRSGFYTQQQMRGIIEYAKERGIEIVPEVNMPGHSMAIISCFPQLCCSGKDAPVWQHTGINPVVLCAGNPQVYELLTNIYEEVFELFPFPYIHLGGDEAPRTEWKKCPKCRAVLKREGLTDWSELQGHMFNYFCALAKKHGRTAIGWNEAMSPNLDSDVINEHWEHHKKEGVRRSIESINNGRKAIISDFTRLYLDYPLSMTPLENVYSFEPVLQGITQPQNILGAECCLWAEWLRSFEQLTHKLLPRLAAASEVMWCEPQQKDYGDFLRRLRTHYTIYDRAGLCYAKNAEKRQSKLARAIDTLTFAFDTNFELKRQQKAEKRK